MECVIQKAHFSRTKLIHLAILSIYFIAGFAFILIGLQPSKSATSVYAKEAAEATATLEMPTINLKAPVTEVSLIGKDLEVPEQIAGAYSINKNKTLIIGHSSTIFTNLQNVQIGQSFTYKSTTFIIKSIVEKKKEDVSMKDILSSASTPTVIIMTCSGDTIPNTDGDHTHRLIVTAEQINS